MTLEIIHGDSLAVLAAMEAESFHACVTDPPYAFQGGFMGRSWDKFDGREDTAFGYWFAGFVDGEGTFVVHRNSEHGAHACKFAVHIRRDDRAILEKAKRFIGHGDLCDLEERNRSNPTSRLAVQTKEGCAAIVQIFRKYPLRAKKRLDFEIWADAVEEWLGRPRGNRWNGKSDQTHAAEFKRRLEDIRRYVSPPWSGHAYQDWCRQWAIEVYLILKPGAHLLAFCGTRTFHRLACAIEDAGFEIRDTIMWLYAAGFPKSHDVSAAIDRASETEREIVGREKNYERSRIADGKNAFGDYAGEWDITVPSTEAAREWQGWGTALKPACELICVARKPLSEGTVAANVLRHGTGALNIDASRVETTDNRSRICGHGGDKINQLNARPRGTSTESHPDGRWPANVCHDGSPEVLDAFARFGERASSDNCVKRASGSDTNGNRGPAYGAESRPAGTPMITYGDTGTAARFFYTAKAGADERLDSKHPTVKPVALMEWLVRLVTPPNGRVLDPFCGTGSTLVACDRLGFDAVGIEQDAQTVADAHEKIRRMRARRMIGDVTKREPVPDQQLRLFE